jgi:hypothetical protein
MKKVFSILVSLFTISSQFLLIGSVTATINPEEIAPLNSGFFVQIDTSQTNPLKGKILDLMDNLNLTGSETNLIYNLVIKNIESNKFSFAQNQHQQSGEDIYYLTSDISDADFNSIIQNADATSYTITTVGINQKIYSTGDDSFFGHKNGTLLISNTSGIISDFLISNILPSTISANSSYQAFSKNILPDSFLNIFVNIEELQKFFPEKITSEGLDTINFEAFSFAQNANSISVIGHVQFNDSALMDSAKRIFTPKIYKNINAGKIIFYEEFFNLKDLLATTIQVLTNGDSNFEEDFATAKEEMKTATGLDLDTDIFYLFQKNTALIMHGTPTKSTYDSSDMIPGLSIVSEVESATLAKEKGEKILAAIEKSIKDSIQDEYDYAVKYSEAESLNSPESIISEMIKKSTVTVNGNSFSQLIIYPNKASIYKTSENSDTPAITISTGMYNSSLFVLSINTNPAQIFSNSGLMGDSEFSKNFTPGTSGITDLTFINLNNLHDYLKTIFTIDNPLSDTTELDSFFEPIHSIFATTKASGNDYISSVKITIDAATISNLIDQIITMTEDLQENMRAYSLPIDFLPLEFSDVHEGDWFYSHINDISGKRIMTGYSDGTFRPNQPITRAEFTKTIVTAFNITASSVSYPNGYFYDVSEDSWYWSYVNVANWAGIVKGYSDRSFRPNQPITRAEAVTILNRLPKITTISAIKELPFTDVSKNDWFFGAVQNIYSMGIINGKSVTLFAPNDNITRAETAKIISLFLLMNKLN